MGLRCRLREAPVTSFWTRDDAIAFVAAKNDPVDDPDELRYADVYCTVL